MVFEWDDGNLDHIAEHGVDNWEAEDAIRDRRRIEHPGAVAILIFPRHGGPGGSIGVGDTVYFNPAVYRIILFAQRGAGKSKP